MNILYILQQSIYNNANPPKWLTLDSNINMMVGAITQVLKIRPDWKFYVLIAPTEDFANISSYSEIMEHPNVNFVPYKFPINAFMNRQHFDTFQFDRTIRSLPKIDVVWNNITELSRNIKTWFFQNYKKNEQPKLITCCYWLDCQEIEGQSKVDSSIAYQWRQFDGFECSDLAAFTCNSTKDAFFKNAASFINEESRYIDSIDQKSTIWDFGYSTEEIQKYKTGPGFIDLTQELMEKAENLPIVVFLNRMSDNNYTRHLDFISAVKRLSSRRSDFRVVFANPSQKIAWSWLQDNTPNMLLWRDRALTREEYFALLSTAKASVHLYTNELYGGCAHREAVECGARVVCPPVNEYLRIHGNDWPFYASVDGPNSSDDLADSIELALFGRNSTFDIEIDAAIARCREISSFESIGKLVVADIETLCSLS